MADPFYEPLPEMGQKPWDLGGAVQEIRERIAGTDDVIQTGRLSPGGLSQEIALAAGELNPEALSDTFIAAKVNETNSDTRNAVLDLAMGVSPTWFGAVGDGIADDTAELQATFAAAGTRPVLIDRHYRITAPIVISTNDQTVLGAGGKISAPYVTSPSGILAGVDIFRTTGLRTRFEKVRTEGGRRVFQFGTEATWPARTPSGHGGSVVGCYSDGPCEMVRAWYADNISVTGNVGVEIRESGAVFWGGPDPANTSYAWPGWQTEIHSGVASNNIFVGKWSDGSPWEDHSSAGIWTAAVENVSVVGNVISFMGDVGVDFETSHNCNASGNILSEIAGGGLASFFASENCVYDSNTVTRTLPVSGDRLGAGFWLADRENWDSSNLRISNNTFVGCGIRTEGVGADVGLVIESNKVRNYPTNHIWLQGAIEPSIRGNVLDGGLILLEGCVRANVVANEVVSVAGGSVGGIIVRTNGSSNGQNFTVTNNRVRLGAGSTSGAAIAVEPVAGAMYGLVAENYVQSGTFISPADATTVFANNRILP